MTPQEKQEARLQEFDRKINEINKYPKSVLERLRDDDVSGDENSSDFDDDIKAQKSKKRGVKADPDYFKKAMNDLRRKYIKFEDYPYKRKADDTYTKKRNKKRNEISALESRIKKKISEKMSKAELMMLEDSRKKFSTALDALIDILGED